MSVLSLAASAVVLGVALGTGLLLVVGRLPRWAAPSLSRRVAPYLRDIADPLGITPLPPAAVTSSWRLLRDRMASSWVALGGGGSVARRLRQAGWRRDVVAFRARQLGWAVGGLGAGGLLVVALTLLGRGGPTLAVLPPLFAAAGVLGCDYRLTRAARQRIARVEEELPTVLEFLSLCLAAGEGLRDALRRVGEVGSGVLTGELRAAVLASGTGSSLPDALLSVSKSLDVPALARAIEHLVAAMDRGAPLAHVLQEQAVDAREDAKRGLLELAGRREILMLLPVKSELAPFGHVSRGMRPAVC